MADLTLEDIARKAGVSRSTVSRVVNGQPYVKPDVREKVLKVIAETGFHPNMAARTLASQHSWMLGLVLPRSVSSFFSDPYFPRLTQGIAHACNQHNYTLSLFLVSNAEDEEKILPRVSRRGFLDGLLVQSGDIRDRLIERLQHAGIPFVVAGRPFHTAEVNYIDVDNNQAAYQAVSYLAGLGRKRIAAITGSLSSTVSLDRKEGYLQAISAQACAMEPALMVESDFTEQGGYSAMQQLLPAQPDAVFAASDTMAIGAMRAARDAGVRIPEQIAFIGFDDLPMAATTHPPLTTVHQPIFDFGVQAVELLLDVIENGALPPRQHILETRLVIRQSCGAKQAT